VQEMGEKKIEWITSLYKVQCFQEH
jgi:hypothetical protein